MSQAFGPRRKARVIGQDDNDQASDGHSNESVVKRPGMKNKKRTAARISFGLGDGGSSATSMADDDEPTAVLVPKRSGALSRPSSTSTAASRRPLPSHTERPTYNAAYLDELKRSTPSTPQPPRNDLDATGDDGNDDDDATSSAMALDVAAPFTTAVSTARAHGLGRIPTAAEIDEKKARRARLAAQHAARGDRSSASSSDDDSAPDASAGSGSDSDAFRNQHDTIAFRPSGSSSSVGRHSRRTATAAPRLAGGGDDLLDSDDADAVAAPGAIAGGLGRRAERTQRAAERAQRRALIAAAEADPAESDAAGSSDSSASARAAYDAAQTRRGLAGNSATDAVVARAPRLAALPTLAACAGKLRARLASAEAACAADVQRLAELGGERAALDEAERGVATVLAEVRARWAALERDGTGPLDDALAAEAGGLRAITSGGTDG